MIYLLLLWLWPISGIIIAITYAIVKTKRDNDVIRFIAVCAGFLGGIPLGPFALSLFFQGKGKSRPTDSCKG